MRNSGGRLRSRGRQPIQRLQRRPRRVLARAGLHRSNLRWLRGPAAIDGARAVLPSRLIRRSLSRTGFPDIAGRRTIMSAETSIEIGEISEADAIGNGTDRAIGKLRVAQHTIGAGESLSEQEGGKCRAVGLKQPLKIAWRDRQMGGDECVREDVLSERCKSVLGLVATP